jgi:hypothetical protein
MPEPPTPWAQVTTPGTSGDLQTLPGPPRPPQATTTKLKQTRGQRPINGSQTAEEGRLLGE